MLSQAVITAWGRCTLAVQADPSEAELLAGLQDYSQTGDGDGQERPQVAVIALARHFGAIPDDGKDASAALLLVGVTQQASPRYNLPLVQLPQKMPNCERVELAENHPFFLSFRDLRVFVVNWFRLCRDRVITVPAAELKVPNPRLAQKQKK